MLTSARIATQSIAGWATGNTQSRLTVAPASESNTEPNQLMEAIVCNIDRVALDAATVMSGINTLRHAQFALKATTIAQFLPSQEIQLSSMLLSLSEFFDDSYRLPEADYLMEHIHQGRAMMQSYVDDEFQIGRERARIVHAESLNLTWRSVCHSVMQLINETDVEMRLSLPLAYKQNSAVLYSLLSGAMNGLSPCINDKGHLYVPQLPRQRRWPRHTVLQECTIEHNGTTFNAFVQDASAGGLGLKQMPTLARNSHIRVTMECGRVFHCIVVWANNGRAGVKFQAPLTQTDPLIAG